MKLRKLILALVVSAIPVVAVAQTPKTDKEADAIKEFLWKKGMSIAPTNMYLAARSELMTEMCGRPSDDSTVKMYLSTASVEAPAPVIDSWYRIFKTKMKETLTLNPEEASAFCK